MFHFEHENFAYFRLIWDGKLLKSELPPSIETLLPFDTVNFLTLVGLPVSDELPLQINFSAFPQQFQTISFYDRDFVVIGRIFHKPLEYFTFLALEVKTGKVFALNATADFSKPLGDNPVQFVNSSIAQLLGFLAAYIHFTPAIQLLIDEFYERKYPDRAFLSPDDRLAIGDAIQKEADDLIEYFWRKLERFDKEALRDDHTYWANFLVGFRDL